jgi:hypothetical protein
LLRRKDLKALLKPVPSIPVLIKNRNRDRFEQRVQKELAFSQRHFGALAVGDVYSGLTDPVWQKPLILRLPFGDLPGELLGALLNQGFDISLRNRSAAC